MSRTISRVAPSDGTHAAARVGALMGSPLVLASCVLVLVVGIGALSTWSNYVDLCRAGEQRAADALRARRAQVQARLAAALGSADALLDLLAPRMRSVPREGPREALLDDLRAVATARHGLTWISASFPDGSFAGVYVDADGGLHGQTSSRGVKYDYAFALDGAHRLEAVSSTPYDPRARGFYQLAVERGVRSWTEPYVFFSGLQTGVSRVEPVYRDPADASSLHCVLTIDFDASGLARLLQAPMTPGQRELVLTADGSVLAAAGVRLPGREARGRALSWTALSDPAIAAARSLVSPSAPDGVTRIVVGGAPYRLEQARVGDLDAAPVLLLNMLPERELYARAHEEARRGMMATAGTALLGLLLAVLLSSSIARLRRKRAEAEQAAERAREEVAELGSYQLLESLGGGGMGEVYRARHKLLAREAALKLIRSADAGGDRGACMAQFFREARVLASLRSVHTVAVYDFGVADDGRYFLAMELLDGLDLEALVHTYGPQPPARVASILAQACASLAEAHAHGLVHRDVKPANLFLCRLASWLDVVKMLDFGLTRAVGSCARSRTVEGTPGYMAPEQALGEPVGPASDLYSLGCVGFWLLTGAPPYGHGDPARVMEAHVSAPLPALPEAVRARTPPALIQLLTRCLAKRAEHRPTSAELLARALRRIADECADGFPGEALDAFWATRRPPVERAVSGDATEAMLSIAQRDELRVAS